MKIPDFLNETTDVKESIFSRENLVENIYNFINQNQKKQ